jgi:hypothetical protein
VRNGRANSWNAEEALLGFLNSLSDCRWNFLGLAVADADHAIAIANDYKSGERKATTTLDHLGNAVDGDNTLEEWAGLVLTIFALGTWATLA